MRVGCVARAYRLALLAGSTTSESANRDFPLDFSLHRLPRPLAPTKPPKTRAAPRAAAGGGGACVPPSRAGRGPAAGCLVDSPRAGTRDGTGVRIGLGGPTREQSPSPTPQPDAANGRRPSAGRPPPPERHPIHGAVGSVATRAKTPQKALAQPDVATNHPPPPPDTSYHGISTGHPQRPQVR